MKKTLLHIILLTACLFAQEKQYSHTLTINLINAWGFGYEINAFSNVKFVGFGVYYNKAFRTDYEGLSFIVNQGFHLPFYKNFALEISNITGISLLPKAKTLSQHIESNIGFSYDYKNNLRFVFSVVTMLDPYNKKMDFNNCWTFRLKFVKFF